MKRKTRAAQTITFKSYLSAIRQRGDLRIEGVSSERLKRWMANENRRKRILDAREAYLARQPQPTDAVTPSLAVEEAILEENLDPHSIIFESKIVPRIEADILKHGSAPGHFYWEATLAAINLPGWVDRIARYARADLKAFFIELGNALSAKRHLWDEKDELIACNYYSTTQLKKPLSQMTEKDASSAVNLPEAAYDKRLLRLGIRKKVGRPRKQKPDKTSRQLSFFSFPFSVHSRTKMETIINGGHPQTSRPEFYRLPAKGGDPYFGFTRSFYYEGENRGYWKLARIRERGKLRGVALVPYDAVSVFVRKQLENAK